MPITTKKYIEVSPSHKVGTKLKEYYVNGTCIEVVELPDLSNATDLEKLEWVLKEIGAGYSIYENIPSDGNKSIETWGESWYDDTKLIVFDSNGKLIK